MTSKILIVEDEVLVALDLSMQLEDEGYECLGPARTPAEALAILDKDDPDFAVLDVNLDGTTSIEVARRLSDMELPFVYVSGYGDRGVIEDMPAAPLVQKPLRFDLLSSMISATLAPGTPSNG
jgi:DNA-binding response OmpR family regulator